MDTLSKYVHPKPLIIEERYTFHKAEDWESGTVWQYLTKLQKLAETCQFEALRERFVCGFSFTANSTQITQAMLTLHTTAKKACATELTEKEG